MISSKSIIINKLNNLDINNIDVFVKCNTTYPISFINSNYKNSLNEIKDYVCSFKNWLLYRKLFTPLLFLNFYNNNKKNIGIF